MAERKLGVRIQDLSAAMARRVRPGLRSATGFSRAANVRFSLSAGCIDPSLTYDEFLELLAKRGGEDAAG